MPRALLLCSVMSSLTALGACGRCERERERERDRAVSPAEAPSSEALEGSPPEAPAPVPDLDVDELRGRLGCEKTSKADRNRVEQLACVLLERMKTSCRPFEAPRLEADAQAFWIGPGLRVEDGAGERGGKPRLEVVVLRAARAETSLPGHLPLRFGILRRKAAEGDALSDLVFAGTGMLTERSAEALDLVRALSDFGEVSATRTESGRAYLVAERGGHLCEAEGSDVLLVLRKASRRHPEDGLYAALRPLFRDAPARHGLPDASSP